MSRPRLSDRVSARRHLVDGDEIVVLHVDGESTLIRVHPREWAVLEAADGTRDIEGIALAARRLGGHAAANRVAQFLAGFESRGLLEEGPPSHHPAATSLRPRTVPDDRPLAQLPGYAFSCDGTGGCCRFYATVLFGPMDVARAHAYVPEHSVGVVPTERLFTPSRGSAPTPIVVPLKVDGACAYLDKDELCAIHRVGGLSAKPVGCAAFPLKLCDDGEVVRIAPSTECGCSLRSALEDGGEPLLPASSTHVRDLPLVSAIESLPEEVPLAGDRWMPRAAVRKLFAELLETLPVEDPATYLWGVADVVEGEVREVRPWAEALAETARARTARDADWRSKTDVTLRGMIWLATTGVALRSDGMVEALLEAPPPNPAEENAYLRASLWGYIDVADLGVVSMLRDRALRIWFARAMPELRTDDTKDPAFAHPLATIDVLMRGHGLSRYVDDAEGHGGSMGSSGQT